MAAQGIKIKTAAGWAAPKSRAPKAITKGVPLHTLRADIDYATSTAKRRSARSA